MSSGCCQDEPVPFAPIEEAVAAIAAGQVVVVVDDASRENEGDLVVAAEFATAETIAFFLNPTSGDLCKLAGLYPAGVLCEVVSEDKQSMARLPELEQLAHDHDLPLISIADLIRYRRQREKLVRRVAEAEARMPTEWGEFTCYVYE